MIKEIQDGILAQLGAIAGVKTVDAWQGNTEELLQRPGGLPEMYVIYQGCKYGEDMVIGAVSASLDMTFVVMLLGRNYRGRPQAAEDCFTLIEEVRDKLTAYEPVARCRLWPVAEDLILEQAGTLVYGLEYRIRTEYKKKED